MLSVCESVKCTKRAVIMASMDDLNATEHGFESIFERILIDLSKRLVR